VKRIFSIVFTLVLVVSLGLVTAAPVLADFSPGWTNITQVAAGYQHTVGLTSDSTVVAVGRNDYGQ
jgi:alpha-tubulin suppressor-like RCC1 family protein